MMEENNASQPSSRQMSEIMSAFDWRNRFSEGELRELRYDADSAEKGSKRKVKLNESVTDVELLINDRIIEIPRENASQVFLHLIDNLEHGDGEAGRDGLDRTLGTGVYVRPSGFTKLPVRVDEEADELQFQRFYEPEIEKRKLLNSGKKMLIRAKAPDNTHITTRSEDSAQAAKDFSKALSKGLELDVQREISTYFHEALDVFLHQNAVSDHGDLKEDATRRNVISQQLRDTTILLGNIEAEGEVAPALVCKSSELSEVM